jgi:predicted homoserine dehydrogenase-like protein
MVGLHEELKAREEGGQPVRVGLVGAGQMGTDVVAQGSKMLDLDVVAECLAPRFE